MNIGGHTLTQLNNTKYLDVIIDGKLSWKPQITSVCKQLVFINANLKRARQFLPLHVLRKVYFATGFPTMDYCSSVQGGSSKTNFNAIAHMENMAAQALLGNYDYINV